MNIIDKETAALLGLLEMLNAQTEYVMRRINVNLTDRRSTVGIDRKYGNLLNNCHRWEKSFTYEAEKAFNYITEGADAGECFDSIRKEAMDFLCLNMIAYEYLTDAAKLNTVLRQIQKRKTRRGALRDDTIKQTIIK